MYRGGRRDKRVQVAWFGRQSSFSIFDEASLCEMTWVSPVLSKAKFIKFHWISNASFFPILAILDFKIEIKSLKDCFYFYVYWAKFDWISSEFLLYNCKLFSFIKSNRDKLFWSFYPISIVRMGIILFQLQHPCLLAFPAFLSFERVRRKNRRSNPESSRLNSV